MMSGSIDTLATMASGQADALPMMLSGSTDNMATMSSAVGSEVAVARAPSLEPGTEWGPYRIGRLLGRGGMGEVYEADHLHSGRRVALKVLRNRLQTQDERARFLREGQLAASLSHPHTVYIFGSEEISGTPVISMELLTGGTLKDRVTANGPMSVDDAVAAVIDLIGGLDAAAAAGILHRDIKPSNCFIDRDGVVKVGDFGLSISTLARDVHQQLLTSGFEGTPQFAPPEQLRGEPLDVRADIYAVGATLYYLLTGRPPFDAADLGTLFKAVTTETPASPRQSRRDIPPRLSAVVMQCLAKTPAARPVSYPALADALRPFLARNDKPAPFITRALAGVLDAWIIVGLPVGFATAILADPIGGSPETTLALTNWSWAATFAYYLVLEGTFGASLCKRLLGLRVVSADGTGASWSQIAVRTTVFYVPSVVLSVALLGFVDDYNQTAHGNGWSVDVPRTVTVVLSFVMFFATARRRNGWTGLHDILSRTRVVARPAATERLGRTAQQVPAAADVGLSARCYGPFVAIDQGEARPGAVVRAFDPVLRRQVWIEVREPSAPPMGTARRDLARPGRLHWLTGRRSADESWDAFEAPDGRAWTETAAASAWTQTNQELLDLANELTSASGDGTQPPLALDRIWRRDNGRIVLLDFAPPASPRGHADLTPERLLQGAASRVPRNPSEPGRLPLSARVFLDRWSGPPLPTIAHARDALLTMAAAPNYVHWWRRAIPGALAAAPVVLMLLVSATVIPALGRFQTSETISMMNLLGALKSTTLPIGSPWRRPEVRSAAEMAIAGRYAHLIRDDGFWKAGVVRSLAPDYRVQAEDILKRHPRVSAAELAAAEEVMTKARQEQAQARGRPTQRSVVELSGVIASTLTALALALVLIVCVVSSLLAPGGVVSRNLGLAAVTRAGREISRARSLARVLVAGLPGIAWFTYLAFSPRVQGFVPIPARPITATLVTVSVLAIGLVWTIVRRTRGPHDVLTGTWVVPR
jgi:uncharacterized RDD family membrane protein YckC